MSEWKKLCAELSKAIWEHPRSYCATRFVKVKAEGDKNQKIRDQMNVLLGQLYLYRNEDYGKMTLENIITEMEKTLG